MNIGDPLRFRPLFRRRPWGGRRLETVLGKPLPGGDDYGESWEIVDHGDDQSVVQSGAPDGTTLHELVGHGGPTLLGHHDPQDQFPLLFKFLDAQRDLSVQVHPNDVQAARLAPPDKGKTEAWVVLHADPGSVIHAGLRQHVSRLHLQQKIEQGDMESCLHHFCPRPGDCILIPAGTVHALGKGLLVAEIQQSSDTTFRLFDWNRRGPDGRSRPLHVEQGLAVIDFSRGPVNPRPPERTDESFIERLVTCEKFVMDRWQWKSPRQLGGDQRFHILAVLAGSVIVENDPAQTPLVRGETMLIPAATGRVTLSPEQPTTMLDIYLPN